MIIDGHVAIDTELIKANHPMYKVHKLNLDSVETLEDCKAVLNFLCELTIKPQPINVEYNGFSKVSKYFY